MRARRIPRGFRLVLVLSLGIHLGAVVALAASESLHPRPAAAVQTVLTTKLVRLGKERPPNWLPRKVEPEPAAAKMVAPDSAGKPPVERGSTPSSARERVSQMGRLQETLERLNKGEVPEGHPEGSPYGEVTNLALAVVGNRYATEIYTCLKNNFAIEGLNPERVANLQATVVIHVRGDGRFFDYAIERGSGVSRYDVSVLRAVERCGKVSAPPAELADQVHRDGIEVEFRANDASAVSPRRP